MSSRYVYDEDARVLPWAETLIPDCRFRPDATAIAHERDGDLVGAFIFDTFSTTGCFMHMAGNGAGWLTRELAIRAFAFPFMQLNYPRVGGLISERNEPSLRLAKKLGAREEGRLREGGSHGEDMVIVGMLRRECRALRWRLSPPRAIRGLSAQDVRPNQGPHHG